VWPIVSVTDAAVYAFWRVSLRAASTDVVAVIDDDPDMLRAVSRLLRVNGFRAVTFDSAEAFLESLNGCRPACLVLDIHLGGMLGLDLQRRLVDTGASPPIIFITGVDDDATRREAIAAGCVAYLRKPFPADLLIGAIRKAISCGDQNPN
jgi:FixJ family two-component response regulator